MNRVTEIYRKYERRIELLGGDAFTALNFGPAHIVWEDGNLDSENIQWCVDNYRTYQRDLSDAVAEQVVESLKELLTVPEEDRKRLWEEVYL